MTSFLQTNVLLQYFAEYRIRQINSRVSGEFCLRGEGLMHIRGNNVNHVVIIVSIVQLTSLFSE